MPDPTTKELLLAAQAEIARLTAERDTLRGLWLEWLGFNYDGKDLLRRVKLAVHGPLRKPGSAGIAGVQGGSPDAQQGGNDAT